MMQLDIYEFHAFFGRRLKTVRKARGLTVEEMVSKLRTLEPSERMNISHYQRVEKGVAKANLHLAFLLADILECSIYDFIPPQHGKQPITDDFHTNNLLAARYKEKLQAIEKILLQV